MPSLIDLIAGGPQGAGNTARGRASVVDAPRLDIRGRANWRRTAGACSASGASRARCTWPSSTGQTAEVAVVSLDCPSRALSLGRPAPSAGDSAGAHHQRPVRTNSRGSAGRPPWLDHNCWGVRSPLGDRIDALPTAAPSTVSCAAEGDGLHQIAVGPVHAGIIEPGHFRFTASGETVVRLEQRLGYTHKGIEGLMAGATPRRRLGELAGRTSGDSTVAYAYCASRGPQKRRCNRGAAASGCLLRAAGGTRAARQPSRRHRRDLQRRVLRA